MRAPVEMVSLERAIKSLQQQLLTKRTKVKDLVAERNALGLTISKAEGERADLRSDLIRALCEDVIDMEEYLLCREAVEDNEDTIVGSRSRVATIENQLKVIANDISDAEKEVARCNAELAEWGQVLPFCRRD